MTVLVTLYMYLACTFDGDRCYTTPFIITREAVAIVSCESGDGHTYGTFDPYARSKTNDGGFFQFNDKTYKSLTGRTNAERDTPEEQYKMFLQLWDDGKGWKHWRASKPCWSQWMQINSDNVAVWKD
jgi:hypothetical protein